MLLSVLICTIPSRFALLQRLWAMLAPQLTPEVEVLWLGDDKKRSIGAKRNVLMAAARGEFIAFVDDDDRLSERYVSTILETISDNLAADVICFTQMVSVPGQLPKPCHYGVELEYSDGPSLWTGKPAHTMVWRRELAVSVEFEDISQGEDTGWARRASLKVKSQVRIEDALYFYDYNPKVSERP